MRPIDAIRNSSRPTARQQTVPQSEPVRKTGLVRSTDSSSLQITRHAGSRSTAGVAFLNGWAFEVAVRAEHAAVTSQWTKRFAAAFANVIELTGVGWHFFPFAVRTVRAGQSRKSIHPNTPQSNCRIGKANAAKKPMPRTTLVRLSLASNSRF